jgi:hypothetical protein
MFPPALGASHSRVARKILLAPLFSLGVLLAGTFLGEDSGLQRRMGSDDDLRNGTLPLGRSVGEAWEKPGYRTACSDLGFERVLGDFLGRHPGIQIWADF